MTDCSLPITPTNSNSTMKRVFKIIITDLFLIFGVTSLFAQQVASYYEQMDPVENGFPSHYPEISDAAGPATSAQRADNFTVPEGETWEIEKVEIYGLTSMLILSFDLFIYLPEQDPDFPPPAPIKDPPGQVLHHQPGLQYEAFDEVPVRYRIFLDEKITLGEGDYWISLVASVTWEGGAADHIPFDWIVHRSPIDAPGEDGSYSAGPSPGGLTWHYDVDHDFTFRLNSPSPEAIIPLSNYGIALGIGLMLILVFLGVRRYYR